MLVCFLKSSADRHCACRIVQFCDRLWLAEGGRLVCIRQFIVNVLDSSPPLHSITMLTRHPAIEKIVDASQVLLDKTYLFNGYTTNGFKVLPGDGDGQTGHIVFDNFECEVRTDNKVRVSNIADKASNPKQIKVDFATPIEPGTNRAVVLTFEVPSMLTHVFPATSSFAASYFNRKVLNGCDEDIDFSHLEIPALKIYDPQTQQGGFDIFLYLLCNLDTGSFNYHTRMVSGHRPDGTTSQRQVPKFIWRARKFEDLRDVNELTTSTKPIEVSGLVNDPFEFESVKNRLENIEEHSVKTAKAGKVSAALAIFAILLAIILWFFPADGVSAAFKRCFGSPEDNPGCKIDKKAG